jgi:hypothetical protein
MTSNLGVWTAEDCALVLIEDHAFRQAVQATGRKRLIVGGLHTDQVGVAAAEKLAAAGQGTR